MYRCAGCISTLSGNLCGKDRSDGFPLTPSARDLSRHQIARLPHSMENQAKALE